MTRLTCLLALAVTLGACQKTPPEVPVAVPETPEPPTAEEVIGEVEEAVEELPNGTEQLDPGTFGVSVPSNPGPGWTNVGIVETPSVTGNDRCETFKFTDFAAFDGSNFRYVYADVGPPSCGTIPTTPACTATGTTCETASTFQYQPAGASISDDPVTNHLFYKVERVDIDRSVTPPSITRMQTGRLYRVTDTASGGVTYKDYWFLNKNHASPNTIGEMDIEMEMIKIGPGPETPDAARQAFITELCPDASFRPCVQTMLNMPWHAKAP